MQCQALQCNAAQSDQIQHIWRVRQCTWSLPGHSAPSLCHWRVEFAPQRQLSIPQGALKPTFVSFWIQHFRNQSSQHSHCTVCADFCPFDKEIGEKDLQCLQLKYHECTRQWVGKNDSKSLMHEMTQFKHSPPPFFGFSLRPLASCWLEEWKKANYTARIVHLPRKTRGA